jgi:serine/threonine protein kinase
MATDGPKQADLTGTSITDNAGDQYKFLEKLGEGATAAVYKGLVVDAKSGENKIGEIVAIKKPFSQGTEADPEAAANAKREEAILAKVSDLKGVVTPKDPSQNVSNTVIQAFIPGKMVTDFMYDKSQPGIVKKEMSQAEKDNISYGLLREYAALQMLNIVHCDLKPDNMMYDPVTSTLKIMDFGNAIDQTQSYRHEGVQGAGLHYLPDEAGRTGNTTAVDLYSIGVIMASLYADRCYMAERRDRSENDSPHEIMDDILGPDVAAKAGMPADLFAIVRHLTQAKPENRPENIALANGANDSIILSDIQAIQVQSGKLRQGYIASANAKNVAQVVKDVLTIHIDLSTIRNAFTELQKNGNLDDVSKSFLATTIPAIDQITKSQAKTLQSARENEVYNAYQATNITYTQSTIDVVKQLEAMAVAHREKTLSSIVSFSKQYDNVGRVILQTVHELKNDKDYPRIEPEKIKGVLETLSGNIIQAAAKKLEKEQGTIHKLQSLRDNLPSHEQQTVRPRRS